MKKALLADPGIVPNGHLVLVVAFENGIVAKIDIRTQMDVFRVKDENTRLKNHILPQTPKKVPLNLPRSMTAIGLRRAGHA